MFDLRGAIPPMVTPFDEADVIRYQDFDSNLGKYLEAGIKGFLVLGSNGESVYLEQEEKLKLIEAARKRTPSSMMLLAGTGEESTLATIELTRKAADLGVDGVLVKNPCYYKGMMSFDVYYAHFTVVADASPVPVVLYNVPVFTGISMESRLIIELAKHPNIRGLKESSGNVQLISEVTWGTDQDRFATVAGAAQTLFPNMAVGARGGIVALACAAPKAVRALCHAFSEGDRQKAAAIQKIIAPAANAVTGKYGIPGLKAAMALEGFRPGLPRRPLLPLGQKGHEDLVQIFQKMNRELAEFS